MRITYGVHHSLLVGECVPAAALGAAFGAQVGVGVGPLAKGEAFWGFEGLVGGAFDAGEVSRGHRGRRGGTVAWLSRLRRRHLLGFRARCRQGG